MLTMNNLNRLMHVCCGFGHVIRKAMLASVVLVSVAGAESLYDASNFRPLVADHVARAVGDTLTVVVIESASASANTGSDADRSTDLDAGFNTPYNDFDLGVGLRRGNESNGGVTRAGTLRAQLSMVVEDTFPNGDLFVRGSQYIKVNDEEQRILISGVVRPIDISSNNVVLSTRLRDLAIEYSGEGFISENQKPSILARFLQWLGF